MAEGMNKKRKPSALARGFHTLVLLLLVFLAGVWIGEGNLDKPTPNPYKPEDFAWENGRVAHNSGNSVTGIDVSYYQGNVDWEQVRGAGIEFAFIRLGYRNSADGQLYEDEMARKNLEEAAAAGLQVGAYFFSQALNTQEAIEEAIYAISLLKDQDLELPLVYDWEVVSDDARTRDMTSDDLMACVHSFCRTVEAAGYESMVYFNQDLSRRLLDVRKLSDYGIWFAMYDDYPNAPCKPDFWQYTDEGTVPGIKGNVDLNLWLKE